MTDSKKKSQRRYRLFIIIAISSIILYVIYNRLVRHWIHTDSYSQTAKIVSDIMSINLCHELLPCIVSAPDIETKDDIYALNTYHYNFKKVDEIHHSIAAIDTRAVLQRLFSEVTSGLDAEAHSEKWFRCMDFVSRRMRHPPLTQPMYANKTMITHPIVLLLLGEGRCGHVARLIVDIGLANNYEARLVQLAAHLVAEIKWDGIWHFIDANADFPIESLKTVFPDLPSIKTLSQTPYIIDNLAARGWMWGGGVAKRTIENLRIPDITWYPGYLLTSSIYFAHEILSNRYSGDPGNPRKISFFRKRGGFADWGNDKYYGWNNLVLEEQLTGIDHIPVEFHPQKVLISAPTIIYETGETIHIPVRFLAGGRIETHGDDVFRVQYGRSEIKYEIRVSSKSRGWDYDYRNYHFMPVSGLGDLAVTNLLRKYEGGVLGADVKIDAHFIKHLKRETNVFIEVVPRVDTLERRGYFAWPSNEIALEIYPINTYKKWNYGKN